MKIGKPSEIQQGIDVTLRSGQAPGSSRSPGRTGAAEHRSADAVHLRRSSHSLFGTASDPVDAVRADKIDEVRHAIAQGHFQVRARVVAERMIREAAQLLETLSQGR